MAKGKKKKKKSSQTDCENSSTAKESHGTKIHRGQTPDITDCTCLTQPQRRKTFLPCFAKKATPPNCPIHSSDDSTVIKKPKSKEKDTTNQPCIVRRIGRWIVKKVTKGKKEEQIIMETLEPEPETVYVNISEPPRRQILCQQALSANGPEGSAQATTTTDNSVEPGSTDTTTDDTYVNRETDRNTVISLKELCMRVAHNTDSTSMDINDGNQDNEIEDSQPIDHDLELENDEYNQVTVMSLKDMCRAALIYPDDLEPEYDQMTVMSLKEMCRAALIYPDDLEYNIDDFQTDHTDERDNHDTNDPELDSASISSECHDNVLKTLIQLCTRIVVSNADDKKTTHTDNKVKANDEFYTRNGNLECDANKLKSLKDLCTTIVAAANAKTPDVTDSENTDSETTGITDNKQKLANDETQSKEPAEKTPKLNNKDMKPECDQMTVMSLKELCRAALIYPDDLEYNIDDFQTDHTDERDNHDTNDPELDSASISSECHGNVLMTLIQLCTRVVVSNADDKKTTHTDDKDKANDEFYRRNGNLECDANKLNSLNDLCTTEVAAANAKTPDVTDSENPDNETTGITDNEQKLANDETQSKEHIEKRPELKNKDMEPEYDEMTVMSLKEMCRAALMYPDDLEYNIDDFQTDHTDERDNHDTNDPELDSASISSECNGNVLMTLIQLCTRVVVSNADDKKTTHTDDKDKANDEFYRRNGNLECDANKLNSLKDLCTTVVAAANAKTPDVTDSENTDSETTGITDNKQKLANDETQSKEPAEKTPKLNNKDMKPECDQMTVMSLKELCRAALIYPDDLEYNIDDFQTDHKDERDNHDTNDPELDSASISSECHGNVLMTLIQLCTRVVVSNADDKKTTHTDDKDKANDEFYRRNGNLECNANKLNSLKDLCTTVVAAANAKTPDVTDSENTDNETTGITDNEQKLANDETQSKEHIEKRPELKNKDMEPEYDEMTVMSLKEMCRAALIYPDDLEYNIDDFQTDHTYERDNHDTNDPELDSASISSECHDNVLMTLIQICTRVVVSNADDKKTTHTDDKDKANDEFYTRNGNLECNANKLNSLKDLCTTIVAAANAKTPDITDNEDTSSKKTGITDNKQKLSNDETQSKEPAEKTPKLNNKDMKPECDQITVSLKDMCKITVTYLDDLKYKTDATGAKRIDTLDKDDRNDPELDNTSEDLEFNGSVLMTLSQLCTKVVNNTYDKKATDRDDKDNTTDDEKRTKNVNLECDRKPMSLKDICTVAIINASAVDVINTEKSPKDDAIKPNNTRLLSLKELCSTAIRNIRYLKSDASSGKTARQIHDKGVCISNDNRESILKNKLKYDKNPIKTLKELCSTAIRTADVKTIMKGIEEDYIFVEIANDMAENCETDQQSVNTKSNSLRHERLADGKNHEDNNTKLSEVNLTVDKKLEKSKDSEDDKHDIKSQTDKWSVQSQVRMCIEEVKKAGKFYENFRRRQNSKAGTKPGDDKSKTKFLKKHHKASTNDAGDQKIGISYTKTDQAIDRQFKLDEDLSEIMMENTRAIAMTLKKLRNNDKGSENELKSGYGYKDNIMPVYDKTELESLTRNRPISEIILENDKAIAMTLKELSATADDNADSIRTRTCDTKQVQVSKTNNLNKFESNNFDLLSGYDPNSPMSLKEIYLKAMRKTYGLKEDINSIEGDQVANKGRDGAKEFRPSLNKFSDMTDYMQKHYLLTSALLALMEMCDKESLQIKDEEIDQYMTKESDTKKECVRELLHLAENVKKLSEATMTIIDDNDKKQQLANNTMRHYRKEIRKVNDAMDEKRATDSSKNTADVNTKNQFRKTKETYSVNDTSHGQTTAQAAVCDIVVTVQKKENGKFEEASGGLPRIKEDQKNVFDSKSDMAFTSENDDENVFQNHADGTDIDKIYKATQAHYDDIDVNQINGILKNKDTDAKHVSVNSLQDTEKTSAGEMTKQKTDIEATDKHREKAVKRVNDRGRDTDQGRMIAKLNTTTDSAKAAADGAGIRQKDSETNRFETKKTSEDKSHDQLMTESFKDRKTKMKSRNKAKLQFEIDYHIDMDGKIIAAKLPENLHTLCDNEYTLPVVEEKNLKRRKQKKVHSRCGGKAGKDSKRDTGARQTETKVKPNSRCSRNENMTLAALYCDDVVYISQATKNPAATPLLSEVTELVQRQSGTEERHTGIERQARQGGLNDQSKEAELASECHTEKNSGYRKDQGQEAEQSSESLAGQISGSGKNQATALELSSDPHAEQTLGFQERVRNSRGKRAIGVQVTEDSTTTASESSTAATSQKWHKKKKHKRKKAKWY